MGNIELLSQDTMYCYHEKASTQKSKRLVEEFILLLTLVKRHERAHSRILLEIVVVE